MCYDFTKYSTFYVNCQSLNYPCIKNIMEAGVFVKGPAVHTMRSVSLKQWEYYNGN